MKILWVNPSFLDYRIPVYKGIYDLSQADFYLLYSKKRVPERIVEKIDLVLGDHAIGMEDETILLIRGKGDFANTNFRFPYQKGLYKAISGVNADILISEGFFQWTPLALIHARLNKKKFLIAYERTAHTERNCPRWRTRYRKFIMRFVDGYIVNGQLTKEYLMQMDVAEDKIFTGAMSADSENLAKEVNSCSFNKRNKLKSALSLGTGLIYLYVGQINERKGIIYLLNAWLKHSETYPTDSLILVGEGPLLDKYVSDFSSCKSIHFAGSIDYDLIPEYYAIADVFVMPTLEDNWSLVVPEAMACGLPIACSIYNGCYPELVHDGVNGLRFDPLDSTSFIETLSYFHTIVRKQFGIKSKEIESRFSADKVAEKIFQACCKVKETAHE